MIVLPAKTYDRLRAQALTYGGVGAVAFYLMRNGAYLPYCAHGLAVGLPYNPLSITCDAELQQAGLTAQRSDAIVHAVNRRLRGGPDVYSRVSWDDYVTEGQIVRGAE